MTEDEAAEEAGEEAVVGLEVVEEEIEEEAVWEGVGGSAWNGDVLVQVFESYQCEKEAGVEDVEPEEVVGAEEEPLSRRVVLMIQGFSSLVLVENIQISVWLF